MTWPEAFAKVGSELAFVTPDHKIRVGVNLMREWPPLRWHYTTRSVPHALWEAHAEEKR